MWVLANRKTGIALLVVLLLVGGYFFLTREKEIEVTPEPTPPISERVPIHEVIGTSVEGRAIDAYTYGEGETRLLFVGGIHGGYEWNSVILAYEFMDYLRENPEALPEGVEVSVIPNANPDGVFAVLGKEGRFTLMDAPIGRDNSAGRFNAHNVDLNRNFGCKWQPTGSWRGNTVSAGSAAFSEPEALALREFVLAHDPDAAIFWHSQANAVYASECEAGILPETLTLMNIYASAAGYPAVESFDAYPVTGDAEGWLASIKIPAITVELSSHDAIEWEKNKKGIDAVLSHFGN